MKKLIPQSIKNIYHLFQAVFANIWFGFPSRRMKVIGVTGTNGKTTTTQMIAKILEDAGYSVAIASTINFKIGEKEWVNDTKFTTFSSFKLQEFLKKAAGAGCEFAIVEVTSHALDQNRVWGIDFSVAVVTNVTREHLDYHKTMEKYAEAKARLFEMVSKNPKGVGVVNLAMEYANEFLKYPISRIYGYSAKFPISNFQFPIKSQIKNQKFEKIIAENIEYKIQNTKYEILDTKYELNLPGEFNVENALAATCVGLAQGISLEKISDALGKIKGVPGRMERIENDRGVEIIVDYAVTPDSLEKLYDYIKESKKDNSKIIAVFGSCGERDRGKRPIMGKIVAKIADYVFVTNEDPYHEDPVQIINEVFKGVVGQKFDENIPNFQFTIFNLQKISNGQISKIKKEGENVFRISDRKKAIKAALQIAKPGDIVVVTGKGAEETMAIGEKTIPWNDPKVIREVLLERAKEESR